MDNEALYILLAEEEGINGLAFKEALEAVKLKNTLNCVSNDNQLIEYLNNGLLKKPDILFLDLNLPLKGGFECLNEIRANTRLNDLIVAVYSSK